MAYYLMTVRRNRGGLTFAEPVGETPGDARSALLARIRRLTRQGFTVTRNGNRWNAVNPERVRVEVYVVQGSAPTAVN